MAIVDELLSALDAVEAAHTQSLASVIEAATVSIVQSSRGLESIGQLSSPHRVNILEELQRLWQASVRASAPVTAELIQLSEKSFDDYALSNYITLYGATRAQQILNTTERQIQQLIGRGIAQGNSSSDVFESLIARANAIGLNRSLIITRTESHGVSQYVSFSHALQSSIALDKIWNTTHDQETRDFGEIGRASQFNHRIMDKVRIPLRAHFRVPMLIGGSEGLMFPGHPGGSAGNIINCRCIQTYARAR